MGNWLVCLLQMHLFLQAKWNYWFWILDNPCLSLFKLAQPQPTLTWNLIGMKCNSLGEKLIQSFEGCKLKAYQDQRRIWTIGWGHTGPDVHESLEITLLEAEHLFQMDLEKFEQGVARLVKVPLNSNEFSALVSFSYNAGIGSLAHSKLLYFLNANKREDAANELLRWDECDGKIDPGLKRRRLAERELFVKPEEKQ